MNKANARNLLRQFDFKGLFLNELGWNDHTGKLRLKVGEYTITLDAIAEKRGMAAYLCSAGDHGNFYDYKTRCRIEAHLAKSIHEHLIIFVDADRRYQAWQWVKRELGRPIARREHTYTAGQASEPLLQKLEALEVKIEDEEQLTLVGVAGMVRSAFDVDRVTKRFYDQFKTEHAAFLKLIDGIEEDHDREWYASITLNRLQFVYFIQKKGFLAQDKDYLRNRLAMVKKTRPKTKFLSFYRAFLLKLFHDGLGRKERNSELLQLLGTVPYLNGGIFAVHPLEEKYADIDIPDKAFEKIFNFFDQYSWHLDERPLRSYDEINPDVLGYIFEKYINQKQMGAYYSKEDITEYIAKNCIIPFILDHVETDFITKPAPFRALFHILSADPDRYIYDPIKHGANLPLPSAIEKGVDTKKANLLERRADWNKPAPSEYALPTEIWREIVARRQRYAEIRSALGAHLSQISISDLITLNLNIRQFAQDCIENATTPDVLWAFWQAIEQITVLDPTCGSGAFLFAAVNVLEPLYEACLDRMKAFMLEWSLEQRVPHPDFYRDFAAIIAGVEKHANEKYFIFKSIIIRNLYGVDIMDEAVEICKLRLFLKLAAQIEPNYEEDNLGIEPLPDIDFNIKAGNTLVGFATEKQAEEVIRQDLLAYETVWPEVQRDALEINKLFKRFRLQQTELGGAVGTEDKAILRKKLAPLEARLNAYLAGTYCKTEKADIKDWAHSHKPFHWFIEFYEIMAHGGFHAIVGNPPYVEYSKIRTQYSLRGYDSLSAGNLYAFVMERSLALLNSSGYLGLIVPHSMAATYRPASIQALLRARLNLACSYYTRRPGKLFDGADQCLCIAIGAPPRRTPKHISTTYQRWYTEERPTLFHNLRYTAIDLPQLHLRFRVFPKLGSSVESGIISKLLGDKPLDAYLRAHGVEFYCHRISRYFIKATNFVPFFKSERDGVKRSDDFKPYFTENILWASAIVAALNSSLFYWFWRTMYDGYHCGRDNIAAFPLELPNVSAGTLGEARKLTTRLMKSFKENADRKRVSYQGSGLVEYDEFNVKHSKFLLDEIDGLLAKHYGFTDEELDFIINYDIKYRMGRDSPDEE